ncbi:glutaredoxin family protein [Paenibacillus sp. M1]|uniref:Glutaredoxin family protein n=1 Tax=Paenibacillus haidiansis TaxID=1574488 RepID=A0ABU7VUU0_9BACL
MAPVIVYTSTNCSHCHQVKSYFSEKGVPYEERNIRQNDEYAQQVWDMGIRVLPVTLIGEHRIPGMNKARFEQALAEQR